MADERIRVILDVDAEVSKARGNINNLTKIFDNIGGTKGGQLREILSQIGTEYDKLAEQSGKAMGKIGDFSKAEKSSEKLNNLFKKLGSELNNIGKSSSKELEKLFPAEIANRIQKANEAIKTYNSSMKKSEAGKGAINQATQAYQKQIETVKKLEQEVRQLEEAKKGGTPVNATTRDAQKQRTKEAEKVYTAQLAKANAAEKARDDYAAQQGLTDKTRMKSSTYRDKNKTYNEEFKRAEELRIAFEQAKAALDKMYVPETVDKEINDIKTSLEQAKNKATEFKDNLSNVKTIEINKALDEAKKKLQDLTGIDLSQIGNIDDLNNLLQRFTIEGVEGLKKGLQDAGIQVKELGTANDQVGAKIENCTNDVKNQNAALEDFNGLKSRIQYFFSLTNSVMLFRRGLQKAFEAVKELDAAMTETAVVTDFSVGDMWDQLPRYTQAANELGTTTLGAYETMTLFYQQGLETNEVFEIGTETMKMARIAGLDYANATDLMTAALRGFNMELNETSATRINDVYSELAAITAADTEEIANAMTKTASIAANANMEFETTAALLSQIIETTREPAETAGTAMKTIIARFTEMKKATSDVINVDGEEVSVNKVEAALKSAGVALRDINGEFRDLDDVFLELSSKWNSLDKMTQRYVATMAAGSRQQSRFIAMMQDYDRTMELVDAAYNSSGASQKQFEKTQDSLESKINRLKNAWNEFLMGITNSSVIKAGVDALTALLNIINKLTGNSGLLKLGVAIGALAGGNKIFNGLLKSFSPLKGLINKEGRETAVSFIGGLTQRLNNFKAGKPFVLDADINTKGITNKINKIKTDFQGLKQAFNEKIPVDTKIGISSISNSMKTLVIEGELAGETIEHSLSEVGIKAILAAQGIEEGSEEAAEFGVEASVAIEAVKKQYEDLIVKAMAYQAIADGTDVDIDLPDINNISRKDASKKAAELFDQANDLNKDEKALKKMKEFGSKSGMAYKNALGQSIKGLGTKIGGTVTAGLSKIAGVFGATGAAAGAAYGAAIVAAVAAIAGSIYATWYNSANQVTKRIAQTQSETLEDTQKYVKALSTEVQELDSAWTELTTGQNELDGMVQGTIEWTNKVQELNAQVQELLDKYPDLYKFLQIDKSTGQWSLEEKGYVQYLASEKEELDNVKNRELYEKAISDYYSTKAKTSEIAAQNDYIWNWTHTNENQDLIYSNTMFRAAKEAYKQAGKDFDIMSYKNHGMDDPIVREYIENMDKSEASRYWGPFNFMEGGLWQWYENANPQEVLKYYDEMEKAEQLFKQQQDAYVRNYMASQGKYGVLIQEAVAQAMYDSDSMLQDLEEDRKNRSGWTGLGKYDGKTGGAGAKMQGESAEGEEKTVQEIMEARGFKLVDKTRNHYINEITGQAVNVDAWAAGGPGGSTKTKEYNGKEYEMETWSNEYVRDLGRQDALRTKAEKDLDKLANVFLKDVNLAKLAAGDLSANIEAINKNYQQDITNDDGEILFDYDTKVQDFEKSRAEKMDNFNKKYGNVFSTTDTKTTGDNTINIYAQEAYDAAQKVVEFEGAIEALGTNATQYLTSTYLALMDLENADLKLNTIMDLEEGDPNYYLKETISILNSAGVSASRLKEYVGTIDMSSAINGARQLKRHLEEGGTQAVLAATVLGADQKGNNFFSVGNQFKELISSEGWEEIQAGLSEIYKLEGQITADNIRELASTNSDLAAVLDTNSLKASGFAKIMEGVEEGTVNLGAVTSDLIKLYDKLYYSVDLAGEAISRLEKAKIGDSDTKIGNIYSGSWAAVNDLIKRGAYGDSQIDDYMKQMIGEEAWNNALLAAGGNKVTAFEAMSSQYGLSANNGNLYGSWTTLLGRNNGSVANGAISIGANGQLTYDLSKVSSTEDLINQIYTELGVSKEYAETLVADMKTYSAEFGSDLEDLDRRGALDDFLDSRITKDGVLNISDYEKAAFAKARGETVEEFENYLKGIKGPDGKTPIIKTFQDRKYSESGYYYTSEDEEGNTQATFTDEKAKEEIKDQISEVVDDIDITKIPIQITDENGNKINNQDYLNELLKIDTVREIILDPTLTDDQKQELLEGILEPIYTGSAEGTANGIAEGLLGETSKTNAQNYSNYMGDEMYNKLGGALQEAMNVLAAYEVFIPITFDLPISIPGIKIAGQQIIPSINIAALSMSGAGITIGGKGSSITPVGGAGTGFTPRNNTYSPETLDVDVGEDGDGDGGEAYINGDDPDNNPENNGGGSDKEEEERNYGAENADAQLEALDRLREVNEREADLISKLPEQIRPFFEMANLAEKMGYEYQEIQINKNKLGYLQQEEQLAKDELAAKGYLDKYMYYDEQLDEMMWNTEAMKGVSGKTRDDIVSAKEKYDSANDARQAVEKELDGGKIQAFVKALSKGAKDISKVLKTQGKDTKDVDKALRKLEKQLGLTEGSLQPLSDKFKEIVSNSKYLNSEFEGLSDSGDKMVDIFKSGPLGRFMSDETAKQLKNGGVTKGQMGGSILGDIGDALGFSGDLLNFDMMGMGMDMFNMGKGIMDQGKQMAEQVIGYITQATQVLVDAWTNREDYLYNFLQIIEKYLHDYEKMQRYSTQLEKGRMATVNDIRLSWEQQWQSLQEQLEMQQERVETRQQQLDMSRWSPFMFISGWNPETDALYENREVKMLWDIMIGAMGMLPMGLGAFGQQLNQLYEDYDKRVQEAYEDRLAAEMAILDIEDERLELVKVGSEETVEFQDKVMEAIVQKEQEQIDELNRLNEAITEANSKLISTLQSNLEQIRQDRENEKKEEELTEKQRRLSYLRQDTSGANAVEIKKLEEQLEEEHEDYTDTLIDQKISELEKQNELAAEQRQQQIDLLQAQLDWSEKYGLYWDAIYGMLYTIDENGNVILNPENFDLDGNIRENGELAKMLGTFTDQIGMSLWAQVLEMDELKRLGRYAGAFVGHNGLDGQWADYWALLDPGADDPDYAEPDPVIPDGFAGVLWKLEHGIREYFARSDGGLIDTFGHAGEKIANGLGDLFGIESWSAYDYKTVMRGDVGAPMTDFFVGLDRKTDAFFDEVLGRGNKYTQNLNSRGMVTPSETSGGNNIHNYFKWEGPILGEFDGFVSKIINAISSSFSGANILNQGH